MPNGKLETIAEIKRILRETREVPKPKAIKPPEEEIPSVAKIALQRLRRLKKPQFYTAEIAKQMGIDIDPDWMLKVSPGRDGETPEFSFMSPEKTEVREEDIRITPEGRWITRERVEALEAEQAEAVRVREERITAGTEELFSLIKQLYPEVAAPTEMLYRPEEIAVSAVGNLQRWIQESPEEFFEDIYKQGRTTQTERLLNILIPELTEEDLASFFAPFEKPPMTELAVEAFKATPWRAPPAEWGEAVKGFPGLMDLMQWLAPTKFGSMLGVAGAYIEKYAMRPWEVALLEANARIKELGLPGSPEPGEIDQQILARIDDAFKKYGLAAVFSEDVGAAWEFAYEHIQPGQEWTRTFFEWTNPAWWIPIGTGAGVAARFTSRIPLLGKVMRYTAAGVQYTERGITYPVAKPIELTAKAGIKGFEKLGEKIGSAYVNRLIKQSKHLEELMELPPFEKDIADVLVDNWQRRTLQLLAKVPPIKWGIEKGLGWRVLVNRESKAVMDIVGRAATGHGVMTRRGINLAMYKSLELKSLLPDPIKYFGFGKNAYSAKMANRLLPEYIAEKELAGTLEHIFTKPEMYNWTRMEAGLEYVVRVNETNRFITELLIKEGVPPRVVSQDWIHRVVESVTRDGELISVRGKPGVRGRGRIGAKPSYEMHREAPTMAEGISWGIQYARNPEISVSSYIEEAFRKIADARVMKYLEPFGVSPAERLAERFPEVVGAAALTKTELAEAAKFHSLINRALRGEKLPTQTLSAIERRFPELGTRLRALVEEPALAEKQLRGMLAQNERLIKSLQKRVEKAEAIDIEAIKADARAEAVRVGIPDDQKLTEAFRLMDYEDRLAFRSTMESQTEYIGRMLYEEQAELEGLLEWLSVDPVATYAGTLGKRKVHLDYFLKKGEFPESFTLKEAALLMQKPIEQIKTRVVKAGVRTDRVSREVVLDTLTEHFHARGVPVATPDDLIEYIKVVATKRLAADDLKILAGIGKDRIKGIKRMLGVLDDVDTSPAFIPKQEIRAVQPELPEVTAVRLEAEALDFAKALNARSIGTKFTVPKGKGYGTLEGSWERVDVAGEPFWKNIETGATKASGEFRIAKSAIEETLPTIPKAEAGMPEAGVQKDIFGYETPVFPKGKGQVTQMSMEDYAKLAETWKKAGLPDDALPIALKPKIEGVKGLEAESQAVKVSYEMPAVKSAADREFAIKGLRTQVKALVEARKAPYWKARAERAFRMEQVKQPGVGEGYIMQPFAGGRIYEQPFIDSFNRFFGHDAGLGVLRVTTDTAGLLRIVKAALDLSYPVIQGQLSWGLAHAYLMFNPPMGFKMMGAWYSTFFQQIGVFFNPNILYRWLGKNEASAMQRVTAGGSMRAVFLFQEMKAVVGEGAIARAGQTLLYKLPLKPYQRAEWAFFAGGELVRDKFWQILAPKAIAKGEGAQLARYLDLLTGIADPRAMGVPLTTRQLEQSFIWFSSAYTRSYLTLLGEIFRGGFTGAKAREAIAGFIGAGAAYYTGLQYAISTLQGKSDDEAWETIRAGFGVYVDPLTGDIEWRPTAGFLSIKIGDTYYGVGGGIYGLIRLAGNISATVQEIGERETIDLVQILKNGSLNKRDNPFISWWYTRSSAFTGAAYELWQGKDFLGYPFEGWDGYMKHILKLFEPIWVEQGINPMIPALARDNEVPEDAVEAAMRIGGEFLGLRVNPEYAWQRFYNYVNETVLPNLETELLEEYFTEEELPNILELRNEGTLRWEHLPESLQIHLRTLYTDAEELYEQAQADSALRNSPHWKQWSEATTGARKDYYDRGNSLIDRVKTADLDTREMREKWSDAGMMYGASLDMLERLDVFEPIYNRFAELGAEAPEYEQYMRLALADYNAIMFTEYLDENGDPDWDRKDAEVDAYIEKWGEQAYDLCRQMYAEKKMLEGLSPILIRLADDKDKLGREYWELPYKPIIEMDEEDLAEGNIPEQYKGLWLTYQDADEAMREKIVNDYPDLAKDWRLDYRRSNPEEDAMLALWGYGGKIQTQEAYDLALQWGRELGMPLEQMGLGLPPRTLIKNYFEYGQIVSELSANNPKAKLYRLENPKWDIWAQENWGWKEVDDNIEVLRISVNYAGQDEEYDAIVMEDDAKQREARLKYLEENPDYAIARRRREAYQYEFPDDQIDTYIEYYKLPEKGYWRDRFLLEHKDFYKSMIELKDTVPFDPVYKVPDVRYDQIYDEWKDLFEQYESVTGTVMQRNRARAKIFETNPEFQKAWLRRSAYGKFFPESQIDNYVAYQLILHEGKPPDVDEWYEDNWFLMENPDFYKAAYDLLKWEHRDFSKVPKRDVYNLYLTYKGLPIGKPRFDFRAKHPELDEWLVIAFGLKPIKERGEKEAKKTPWERKEEAERFKGLFK